MTKQSQIATKVNRHGTAMWNSLHATVLIAAQKTGDPRYTERGASKEDQAHEQKKRIEDDDNFYNRAYIHAPADLKRVGVTGAVVSAKADTGERLIKALEDASQQYIIKNLVVYCHAGNYGVIMREDIGFTHDKQDVFQNSADVAIRKRDQGMTDMKLFEMGLRDVSDLASSVRQGRVTFVENPTIVIVGCYGCGNGGCRLDAVVPTLADTLKATVIGSFSGSNQSKLTAGQQASGKWEYAAEGWWRFSQSTTSVTQLTEQELGSSNKSVMRTAAVLRQ